MLSQEKADEYRCLLKQVRERARWSRVRAYRLVLAYKRPDHCIGATILERMKGIEPSSPVWKTGALPLSYTRVLERGLAVSFQRSSLYSVTTYSVYMGTVVTDYTHFLAD